MKSQFHNNRHSDINKKVITVTAIFVSKFSFIQKMILTAPQLSSRSHRKVPFEPFSVLKIISMQQENNAVSNHLSFLQFFFYFWMFPYSFLSSPGCFTLKTFGSSWSHLH